MKLFRRKDSPVWFVSFYTSDGKRVKKSTHCTDRVAALAMGRQFEREAASGETGVRKKAILSEGIELFLKEKDARKDAGQCSSDTVVFYQFKTLQLLEGLGKNSLLASFRPSTVDGYVRLRVQSGVSSHTVAKELATLRSVLATCKRHGLWTGDLDVLMPLNFGKQYQPRSRFLTATELNSLLAQLTASKAAQVAFMVATSARLGEAHRAKREDINGGMVKLRGTKTNLSERTVPIVAPWGRSLLTYCEKYAGGVEGRLFPDWSNIQWDLRTACERADIPRCSPNDLRRTCATWLRQGGAAPDLVACVLGHSTSQMVERVYGRLSPGALQARLEAAFGGTPVGHTGGPSGTPSAASVAELAEPLDGATPRNTEGDRSVATIASGDFVRARGLEPPLVLPNWNLNPALNPEFQWAEPRERYQRRG